MSHKNVCLNCNSATTGNFCSNCGQKTDTHRITLKHFLAHDLLHGIWHIERGILFTAKEGFLRPGKAALDYISGKRIKYYNVFYLILIIIGLTFFVNSIYDKLFFHYYNVSNVPETNNAGKSIDHFFAEYSKIIIFSFVPVFALNSFILFRKRKLNISEHFIIAGMVFLGVMLISLISSILYLTEFLSFFDFISRYNTIVTPIVILLFVLFNYYRTFKDDYSIGKMILKIVLFFLMFMTEIIVFMILLVGYFTNWTFVLKYVT